MQRSCRGWRVVLIGVLCALTLGHTPNASALNNPDNMIPTPNYNPQCTNSSSTNPGDVCRTDNANLVIHTESSVTGAYLTAVNTTLGQSYQPTDLSVSATATPVTSGSGETDIMYQVANNIGNIPGLTWCNDAVNGTFRDCDQQYVRFDPNYAGEENTACHETGHAVGLTHGAQAGSGVGNNDPRLGCLRSPANAAYKNLLSNNIDNINSVY